MEPKPSFHVENLTVLFYLPRNEAGLMDQIADSLKVRRSVLLRSLVHASLEKLNGLEKPATSLGEIENAIIGNGKE